MSHLDDELRSALRPEAPPDGFVDRVLARLPAEPPQALERPGVGRMWWLAAAAALAVAAIGLWLALPRAPEPAVASAPVAAPRPAPVDSILPGEPGVTSSRAGSALPSGGRRPISARRPRPVRVREDAEALRAAEQLRMALEFASVKLRETQRETGDALRVPES
jgi:hypothetical protein